MQSQRLFVISWLELLLISFYEPTPSHPNTQISGSGVMGSGWSSEGLILGAETGKAIQTLDGDSHWIKMAISNSAPLSAMRKVNVALL